MFNVVEVRENVFEVLFTLFGRSTQVGGLFATAEAARAFANNLVVAVGNDGPIL